MSQSYSFVLKGDNGKYEQDATIELPRVSTILGVVLNKPQLYAWVYRQTVDNISGLLSEALQGDKIVDLEALADAEQLDEWIRDNHAHPDDVADVASERGKKAHALLSTLAETYRVAGPANANAHAEKYADGKDPYQRAVASWWLERQPEPMLSEQVVYSFEHQYAGRCDLVAMVNGDGPFQQLALLDLKTRRSRLPAYTSDMLQLDAYAIALRERGVHAQSKIVLLADENGEWKESVSWVPDGAFVDAAKLYRSLRKTRDNDIEPLKGGK